MGCSGRRQAHARSQRALVSFVLTNVETTLRNMQLNLYDLSLAASMTADCQ